MPEYYAGLTQCMSPVITLSPLDGHEVALQRQNAAVVSPGITELLHRRLAAYTPPTDSLLVLCGMNH